MIVYDFEVFRYDWLVVFKTLSDQKYTIIENNRKELEEFYNKHKDNLFVGYNNIMMILFLKEFSLKQILML